MQSISFTEADTRFQLSSILPAYNEEEDVIVLASGRLDASSIDLDEHSYVVDGDLEVEGTIRSSEEGGFLVVRGDFKIDNLLIGGPIVHVTGSLTASHAIHTDYNHGELAVEGDVRAHIIAAEHHFRIGGKLVCDTTIDFGGFDVADPDFVPTLTRQQAARESSEYFVAEVLNSQGYVSGAELSECLADGKSPLLRTT
jgi:hypothetical protein